MDRGLKYISKNRVKRINAIASFLSTAPYNIVCLQELFVARDFGTVRASLSDHLPFVKLFHGCVALELMRDCILTHRVPVVRSVKDLPYSLGFLSLPQPHTRILSMALLLTQELIGLQARPLLAC